MSRHTKGFTLIEAMVSMAIAGVILAGATGAVMNINRHLADLGRKTAAWDEAKRLEEFLIARVQATGGGALRPHDSIFIENAGGALAPGIACRTVSGLPSCTLATQGADRLTVFTPVVGVPECTVSGNSGVNLNVEAGLSACCFSDAPNGDDDFEDREGLLIGTAATVSIHLHNVRAGPCKVNAPPGQGSGLLHASDIDDVGYPATLVVATAQTFFVDRATHTLQVWNDTDGNGAASAAELTVLHDQVYDLQVAAGYDGLPEDGRLVDANSAADEFLYNSPSDTAMATSVSIAQLRMLQIAVAVGTPSRLSGGNSVKLLDRATAFSVPNVYITSTSSKAFMRNLALFTQ